MPLKVLQARLCGRVGESVAHSDRRKRELRFVRPFPPLTARPHRRRVDPVADYAGASPRRGAPNPTRNPAQNPGQTLTLLGHPFINPASASLRSEDCPTSPERCPTGSEYAINARKGRKATSMKVLSVGLALLSLPITPIDCGAAEQPVVEEVAVGALFTYNNVQRNRLASWKGEAVPSEIVVVPGSYRDRVVASYKPAIYDPTKGKYRVIGNDMTEGIRYVNGLKKAAAEAALEKEAADIGGQVVSGVIVPPGCSFYRPAGALGTPLFLSSNTAVSPAYAQGPVPNFLVPCGGNYDAMIEGWMKSGVSNDEIQNRLNALNPRLNGSLTVQASKKPISTPALPGVPRPSVTTSPGGIARRGGISGELGRK